MSKALDRVLQPDGSYRWEEVELTPSKKPEPVIESKPEKKVITEKKNYPKISLIARHTTFPCSC